MEVNIKRDEHAKNEKEQRLVSAPPIVPDRPFFGRRARSIGGKEL